MRIKLIVALPIATLVLQAFPEPALTQTPPAYCSILYGIDNTGTNFSKIYNVNVTNAEYKAATANSGATATNTLFLSAAAALEPSTGRLFYISRDTSGTKTAYWDPVTNTHTQRTLTFNANSTVVRAAFSPSGRLFVATTSQLFEINPATGAQISSTTLYGVSAPSGGNGDMAFDGNNVLFLASDNLLYTIDINNFSASSPANLLAQGASGTTFNSLGFKPDGKLYAFAGSNRTMYEINTNTGALTVVGTITFNPTTGASVVGTDYASCAAPIPVLQSTKTYAKVGGSAGSNIMPGDIVEYTVTTTNVGSVPATKVTFRDSLPAGVNYVPGSTTMNGVAVTDATGGIFPFSTAAPIQSAGLKAGVVGTGSPYKVTIQYRIIVNTVNPPTSITNQGTTFYLGNSTGVKTDDPNTPTLDDATIITTTFPAITISGRVWNDADNSANNTFSNIRTGTETGTDAGGLHAILVNSTGNVIATAPIATDGTYLFTNVPVNQTNVTIRLSTMAGTIGTAAPTASVPLEWINTSPLTTSTFNIGTTSITGRDFGIERPPDTNSISASSQTNPGGASTIPVPSLSGTDAEDGALGTGKRFKIVTLPTNGTLFYNGAAVTTGQVISNYDPTKLTIDPNDGAITVSFTYAAIDAAGKEDPTPATVTLPFSVSTNPNVLLVKRITAINNGTTTIGGDNLALYKDEPTNFYDDNTLDNPPPNPVDTDQWVDPNTFLVGGIKGGNVRPGDEIEYTIYFLSAGDSPANNVLFCDRVPSNVTFLPTAFSSFAAKATGGLPGSDRGIQWLYNGVQESLTNVSDGDAGRYFPPGDDPSKVYPNLNCGGVNTNGAIVVNLGNLPNAIAPGSPINSYGWVRFRGRVK